MPTIVSMVAIPCLAVSCSVRRGDLFNWLARLRGQYIPLVGGGILQQFAKSQVPWWETKSILYGDFVCWRVCTQWMGHYMPLLTECVFGGDILAGRYVNSFGVLSKEFPLHFHISHTTRLPVAGLVPFWRLASHQRPRRAFHMVSH